jgi:hypothetical protein
MAVNIITMMRRMPIFRMIHCMYIITAVFIINIIIARHGLPIPTYIIAITITIITVNPRLAMNDGISFFTGITAVRCDMPIILLNRGMVATIAVVKHGTTVSVPLDPRCVMAIASTTTFCMS